MKQFKKVLAILLTVLMIVSAVPLSAFAADPATGKIIVESKSVLSGDTVEVNVVIQDNPGILGATLAFSYDDSLTLVAASAGEAFGTLVMTRPGKFTSPCQFVWDGQDLAPEDIKDGVILRLTFAVSDEAVVGSDLAVNVSYRSGDIVDANLRPATVETVSGKLKVIDYIPGDVNGDKVVNSTDVILMRRHIAGGYDQSINELAADVNDDGICNSTDVILTRRYIAGGYDVVLLPSHGKCNHILDATETKTATCTENGNIAYWQCSICKKYFSDAEGLLEISADSIIVEATGHTPVDDPAVPATYTSTGLTAGSHCAVCGEVLVAQEVTPKLESKMHAITYDIANGDSYLASINIENKNEYSFSENDGYVLKNLSAPGYRFLGWYDGAGNNAEQVKSIAAGTRYDVELFAHWEKIYYKVQFNSDLIPVDAINYTVDTGATLPSPHLDGYIFTGWSDGEGEILKVLPVGTTGNKVYTANWLSERNKAWAKKKLDAPIIVEDDKTGTILFTYEIGRIENVPLYVIENFGYINSEGITRTITKEYTVKTEKTLMDQYANNVANATTNSSQWSLSSGWSNAVEVSENYLKEEGLSQQDAHTLCTTDSDNWMVSSGTSGSTTSTKYESAQEYDLHTETGNTKTYNTTDGTTSKTHKQSAELDLSAKEYGEFGAEGSIEVVKLNAKSGYEFNQELDLGYEGSRTKTTATKKGTEKDDGNNDQTGSIKHTGTDTVTTGGWNKSSSYGGSHDVSESTSVSKTVSEKIASEYGYGKSYIDTGDETNTQGLSTSASTSNTYTAAVTYGTEETVTETITYTTANTKTGYHRLIKAGTAHVFAAVGYDIKTASYFVSTYTVMDDETHNFEDYSYSSALYDDNQSGIIPFEVPYEVEEYVLGRVGETEGLEFNSAGIVTGYTGTETAVVIPEYHVVDNRDGTRTVLKVTGFTSNAFAGNTNITGVDIPETITAIPDNAFDGCTSLTLVNMPGVTSIGKEAFKNCPEIDTITLSEDVTSIGENAFDGLYAIIIYSDCIDAIQGAVHSGAENIVVYLSSADIDFKDSPLLVSEDTTTFILNGCGQTVSDLCINSDAEYTIINNITINTSSGTPIKTSSPYVHLGQVTANASGIALALTNDSCALELYGESSVTSASDIAMLCKDVVVTKSDAATKNGVYSELEINGDIYICGEITDNSLVAYNGELIQIDEEEFAKYLMGVFKVTFDAAGGTVSSSEITALYGTPYGTLPTATKTGFAFAGWYTEGGEKITSDSIVRLTSDTVLYAHWTTNAYTATWSAGTGTTITVSRTSSPNGKAATGTLSSGAKVYYGDVLSITYAAKTGYTLATKGKTSITVTGNVTSSDIFATATVNSFTASWSTGTGYTITVKRTSSPLKGAATGTISSGTTVYYGDVLSITYTASTGYTLGSCGKTSITVTGNVTKTDIYGAASPNSYTYNIVYKSSNGTNLGSTTATYKYGTTNTITPPAKTGYGTPAAQSVKWDSTSAKTITFTYYPSSVAASTITSGTWTSWSSGKHGISYSVRVEYGSRTPSSVQMRIVWTNTVFTTSYLYFGNWQRYSGTIGGVSTGTVEIASSSTWSGTTYNGASSTGTSGWLTVPVSATTTSTSVSLSWSDAEGNSGTWSGTVKVPAY